MATVHPNAAGLLGALRQPRKVGGTARLMAHGHGMLVVLLSLLGCAPITGAGSYSMQALPLDAASAINNAGAVAGRVSGRAAVYTQGQVVLLPGKAGYSDLTATDIADSGLIVGWGMSSGNRRGLFWSSTTAAPIDMGALGNEVSPTSINSQGVAVGFYQSPSFGPMAFRWSLSDGMMPIAPPTTTLSQAFDISDTGYIAGLAFYSAVGQQAVRWNPPDSSASRIGPGIAQRARRDGSVFGTTGASVSTLWPLAGVGVPLGPSPGTHVVTQMSGTGRLVGFTVGQPDSPRPWTTWQSNTPVYLPAPAGSTGAANDVNACGTILGSLKLSGLDRPVIWSRMDCDILPPSAAAPAYPAPASQRPAPLRASVAALTQE